MTKIVIKVDQITQQIVEINHTAEHANIGLRD
jgi:hypothetical protein